jgi:DNA-binding transcriptional LysR family regulator
MTDIRQIKAFIAVAEELNFHRAAEKLGTVQPALSRLIRNLEIDLKVKLFERTTRHVSLTETGKLFLGEAHALIAQLASAVRAAQSAEKGQSGALTLAYMDFAVHSLLPELLASVAKAGPGIGFQLIYMSTAQQRLALMESKIDMGMMIGQMNNPFVESLRIADKGLTVVLPSGHRLAAKRTLRLSDILNEPILLGSEAEWSVFRESIFGLYAQQGASPRIIVEASSAAALFGLVAKGMGISFYAGVPRMYQSSSLAFRPLKPVETVPISLVWRKGAKLALVRQVLKVAGWGKT